MLGKGLLTLSAAGTILGPFIADFNETHVLIPRWPPHAKFHNGRTMSMGLGLGLATLFYTYRPCGSVALARDSLRTAAIFGSIYWATGLSTILYPESLPVWRGISAILAVSRTGSFELVGVVLGNAGCGGGGAEEDSINKMADLFGIRSLTWAEWELNLAFDISISITVN